MKPAISVENLGKCYRLNHERGRRGYRTLRESMAGAIAAPLRRLREGRSSGSSTEDFWALDDVSFEVKPGEVLGIIGRNGAGKSTLLKILSRITKPTRGQVALNGRIASLLEVGTGFHPELTGRENIYLNGSILGMARREIAARFDEIVDFSGVEKFLDTPVKRYSSGMYVRLAFAVAAHLASEVLVIDEVLAVGDAAFQKKCLNRMGSVARDGRTVLFVSHNMPAVRTLCTRACVLDRGKVVVAGEVNQAISHYLSESINSGVRSDVIFEAGGGVMGMISAQLTSGGRPGGTIHLGDPLTLDVEFSAEHGVQMPTLGYVISNKDGDALVNANTLYQQPLELTKPVQMGKIRCELGVIPLMPGDYSISLWFGDPYANHHIVENALSFEVLEADIWGTSKMPPRNCSHMWWPTKFAFFPMGSRPNHARA